MKLFSPVFLLICALTFFSTNNLQAQTAYGGRVCGVSPSLAGSTIWDYNDVFNLDMQYCDGANWFSLFTLLGTACTAADVGKLSWNAAGYYEYCDGTNWNITKGKQFAVCANADNKKMRLQSIGATSVLQFCDSSFWYSMGPSVVTFTSNGTFTVPTYATGFRITVWGGGGGGGEAQISGNPGQGTAGGPGTTSSVAIPAPVSLTITSTGGTGGGGGNNTVSGSGGTGGTGTNGDTNVAGGNGVAGANGTSGVQVGGNGGAAFKGGKAGSHSGTKGVNGLAPGGGGAGDSGNNRRAGGGGGAGGYAAKLYSDTSLIGLTLTITVGTGGSKGGSGISSGNGGAGKVVLTYW